MGKTVRKKFMIAAFLAGFLQTHLAHASGYSTTYAGFAVEVQPIIGFEHSQILAPTPHWKNRLLYGARATAGMRLLAGELEYTRASSNDAYPVQALTTQDQSDQLKLGIRSGIQLSTLLTLSLRAGGQATKGSHDETQGGVTTHTSQDLLIRPYAGSGFAFALSDKVSANAEVVAVFDDLHDISKTSFQTTAGFSFRI